MVEYCTFVNIAGRVDLVSRTYIVVVREAIVVIICVVGTAVIVRFSVTMAEAVTVVEQGSRKVCKEVHGRSLERLGYTWTSLLQIALFVRLFGSCWSVSSSFACGSSCCCCKRCFAWVDSGLRIPDRAAWVAAGGDDLSGRRL